MVRCYCNDVRVTATAQQSLDKVLVYQLYRVDLLARKIVMSWLVGALEMDKDNI